MRGVSSALPWLIVVALCCGSAGCGARQPVTKTASAADGHAVRTLSTEDWQRLRAGERVEYPRALPGYASHYIGGISYQLVEADPDTVLRALLDPDQLRQMLPQTKRVVPVGSGHPAPGLELEQGNDLVTATYSVLLEHDLQAREVRFSLDRSRPSDIEDVEGFFRVAPADRGKSLITVGTALDVGSGLVRFLFEELIQELILATPSRMKGVVEASARAQADEELARLAPAGSR